MSTSSIRASRASRQRAAIVLLASTLFASVVACSGAAAPTSNAGTDAGTDAAASDAANALDATDAEPPPDGETHACWSFPPTPTSGGCYDLVQLHGDAASCGLTVQGPNAMPLCERLCGRTDLIGCNLTAVGATPYVQCAWCTL